MPITVSIVEDNSQLRESLSALLAKNSDFCCLSSYGSAEEALVELPQIRPDVVLMDINLPGMNGVECVRQLQTKLPETQIIMLTAVQNAEAIYQALAAGAVGYLLKQDAPGELLAAIRTVHAGGAPMNSLIARKIVQLFRQMPVVKAGSQVGELSPREAQILDLLAQGLYYKEIAEQTELAYATVHTHIRNIYKKLQVRSRTEAVSKHLNFSAALQRLAGVR